MEVARKALVKVLTAALSPRVVLLVIATLTQISAFDDQGQKVVALAFDARDGG